MKTRALLLVLGLIVVEGTAAAETSTKECLAAAEQSIALRESGKLIEARTQLAVCSRAECPAIVKQDCVGQVVSLDQKIPTVTVSVTDENGKDIIDAAVEVDGVALPLDGRAHALDPGSHAFHVHKDALEATETIMIREGELARAITIRLEAPRSVIPAPLPHVEALAPQTRETPKEKRPTWLFPGVPIGLAAAGVIAVGVSGLLSVDLNSRLDDSVCAPTCSGSHRDSLSSELVASNALLIGGISALVLAAGSFLVLRR